MIKDLTVSHLLANFAIGFVNSSLVLPSLWDKVVDYLCEMDNEVLIDAEFWHNNFMSSKFFNNKKDFDKYKQQYIDDETDMIIFTSDCEQQYIILGC